MKIDCYLSSKCGSEATLRENIAQALRLEHVQAELSVRRIDEDEAVRLGVTGSPSVFIDGRELQPQALVGFS